MKKVLSSMLFYLSILDFSMAQHMEILRQKIDQVIAGKSATVGVAIRGYDMKDTLSINGNKHLPMQSIFKFHLALAVLHQVDQGKVSLNEVISIDKELVESYNHLWSPIGKAYPNGGKVALSEILEYTVAWSDNLGCDLLFQLVGGTDSVQSYLHDVGIKDIAISHNEMEMQAKWEHQYENWTTAKAANLALQLFLENVNDLLSTESHDFLLEVLKGTKTGKKSIRGLLPEETVVAHKTGRSGKNDKGLTGALNNIGIIFLPNGSYFYLSVLVTDSMENDETNQKIIAGITKLAWEHFTKK
ncbi:MAG: class A beta-lactamase, subclass A2 [Bacteroidota bacterium]